MRNTLKYYENKVAFEPKYGRTYEKCSFELYFSLYIYLIIFRLSKNNENMRNEMKKSFSGEIKVSS